MTTSTASPAAASDAELAAKVPAITVLFWVIKTLTTGMGEALSDFLANTDLAAVIAIGVLGLAGALWLQLRTRRYTTLLYWLAAAMVACSARRPQTACTSSASVGYSAVRRTDVQTPDAVVA